jgi:hypothetical protein
MTVDQLKGIQTLNPDSSFRYKRNIVVIGTSIFLLYIFNNILYFYSPFIPGDPTRFFWILLNNIYNRTEISFLTENFISCLWPINLFLLLTILGYFSFFFINQQLYKKFVLVLISVSGLFAIFVVYLIYPFNPDVVQSNIFIKIVLIMFMLSFGLNILRLLLQRN